MSKRKFSIENSKEDNAEQTPVKGDPVEYENISDMSNTDTLAVSEGITISSNENELLAVSEETTVSSNENELMECNETEGEVDKKDIELFDMVSTDTETPKLQKKRKINFYILLRILFSIGFIVFTALFINEVFVLPYRIDKSIEQTKNLYNKSVSTTVEIAPTIYPSVTAIPEDSKKQISDNAKVSPEPIQDPTLDDKGRLLVFQDLLKINSDVKGWLTIPDTNIDYVVMQSSNDDPEYYLSRDIKQQYLKAGSLFLDYKSSVEQATQNLVIHGHNMTSTDNMFHYLLKFKQLGYYKARPVFTFDSIYQTGQWKIFAIIVTNGTSTKEPLFNYTRAVFKDSSDFLNFVYQLRIRSIYNIDDVDINEKDQLITLSTCSYEVKHYRTVIIARKIREGEEATVDVDSVSINQDPLYPGTWYYRFGGKAPELAATFEEALENGDINWYAPVESE